MHLTILYTEHTDPWPGPPLHILVEAALGLGFGVDSSL